MALTNLSRTSQVNLAINGNFDIWQRVENTTTTVSGSTSTVANYIADMFQYSIGGGTAKSFTVAQSSGAPSVAQSSFVSSFSYLFTMTTGIASFAAADYIVPIQYNMEGYDFQAIHQQTVTYGFWINASIAGTYSFFLQNGAANRSYVTSFTVSSPSIWQFVSITVPMDTSGTWTFTNSRALTVGIGTVSGTTGTTSSLNVWQTGAFGAATGFTNWAATSGATVSIAQFSIVLGNTGFSANTFSRAGVTIQRELALCQRYYWKSFEPGIAPANNLSNFGGSLAAIAPVTGGRVTITGFFPVQMRSDPTLTYYSLTDSTAGDWTANPSRPTATSGGQIGVASYCIFSSAANTTASNQYNIHMTAEIGL